MNGLALVEAVDHVCCRYRIRAFLPEIQARGGTLRVEPLAKGPAARASQLVRAGGFDVVLLQRKLLPSWAWRLLRARARRLVFDFDDAVLFRDSYDPRGPYCRRRAARFARTVRESDLVIAGNAFLAGEARRHGASPGRIRVIPTCVDTSALTPALVDAPRSPLTLAWIGSSSTLQGLEAQRPLLEQIGRHFPDVRLRLICDRFARFDPLPVECVPWSREAEADALRTADAGISWIPDDLWSRGKCGLKILQYLACGLPVVTNPVGVHPEMVREGVEGFLASSPDEWIRAVGRLAADPALRTTMGRNARATAVDRYSVDAWKGAFAEALSGESRSGGADRGPRMERLRVPDPRFSTPAASPSAATRS